MDIRSLKYFLALAENLHFGRASAASHISLSTLSRQIRQLEEDLGVALFVRDNRSVQLTHEGQLFMQYAREAIGQWRMVRDRLSEVSGHLHGEVSLYCSVTAVYSLLLDLFNELRVAFPDIEIKLHTGDPDHAIERVLAGEEDMSIAAYPDTLPRGLAFKPITISPLVFIAPVDDQQLNALPLQADFRSGGEEFARCWSQVPMILPEGGLSRKRIDDWFRRWATVPQVYAQVAGNEAIVTMVSLGLGVGVVPKIVLDNSPVADRVRILPLMPELEPYNVGIFVQKKSLNNPLVAAFWSKVPAGRVGTL
ncbi:MAG: HTH-type transcriptional activator IlvY [Gammaproteobacteria bacterium]|jgi:LysR family positive regulator for ilvC|nr:HTH-type transcriptional activator IlvY [Gammaproteobacteria bacterium]